MAGVVVCVSGCSRVREIARVEAVIDGYHASAGAADLDGYIGAMSARGVFLGTDATERWTREEFAAFCEPYFSVGRGWVYEPSERFVEFSRDGRTAWFDEVLTNASYGTLRGTGVLSRHRGRWEIEHYSLTFLVPNEVAKEVVEEIERHGAPGTRH
jgi:hypothetical protein